MKKRTTRSSFMKASMSRRSMLNSSTRTMVGLPICHLKMLID